MAAILSQHSTTGFYKAPVSKGILGCVFLTSCALNVPLLAHFKQYVICNIPSIFEKYEIWRVITSRITFLDPKDVVCGSLLIYYFRVFERRYGSRKFASYLLAACTVATILELTTISFLQYADVQIKSFSTGPYGLIFPLFVNYFMDIPRVAQTYIMGVPVTGKTLTYLLGLQVISTNKASMISGICSLAAGIICKWNICKIVDIIKFPKFIASFANATLGWLLHSSPPQEDSEPIGATLEIQRQQRYEIMEQQILLNRARETRETGNSQNRQHMAQGYSEQLIPPNNEGGLFGSFQNQDIWNNTFGPRNRRANINNAGSNSEVVLNGGDHLASSSSLLEQQVRTLVEMGFDRQDVLRALQSSNNDIHLATIILLNES